MTKSTPTGSAEKPVDPIALALGAGATFVARTVDRDKQHLPSVLRAAAEHPGTALIEVLQNCPVFNDNAFEHVTDKTQAAEHRIPLVHGEPIRFGAESERGVVRRGDGTLAIADVADVGEDALLVHDAGRPDPSLAFALSQLGDLTHGPVPVGVFRQVAEPAWGDGLVGELRERHAAVGETELDAILRSGDTWTVGAG